MHVIILLPVLRAGRSSQSDNQWEKVRTDHNSEDHTVVAESGNRSGNSHKRTTDRSNTATTTAGTESKKADTTTVSTGTTGTKLHEDHREREKALQNVKTTKTGHNDEQSTTDSRQRTLASGATQSEQRGLQGELSGVQTRERELERSDRRGLSATATAAAARHHELAYRSSKEQSNNY